MEFQNHHPKIFILAGVSRQGKDTVANFIRNYYEKQGLKTINLMNSDSLKDYAKRITGWDGKDETKPREFLQELGTNLIRNEIDEHFFIRRLIEDIEVLSYFYDVITISDARMPYEIDLPKEKFPYVKSIHVIRPNFDNGLTGVQSTHRTETSLKEYSNYDAIILNDGTLEDLKKKTENLLERM